MGGSATLSDEFPATMSSKLRHSTASVNQRRSCTFGSIGTAVVIGQVLGGGSGFGCAQFDATRPTGRCRGEIRAQVRAVAGRARTGYNCGAHPRRGGRME